MQQGTTGRLRGSRTKFHLPKQLYVMKRLPPRWVSTKRAQEACRHSQAIRPNNHAIHLRRASRRRALPGRHRRRGAPAAGAAGAHARGRARRHRLRAAPLAAHFRQQPSWRCTRQLINSSRPPRRRRGEPKDRVKMIRQVGTRTLPDFSRRAVLVRHRHRAAQRGGRVWRAAAAPPPKPAALTKEQQRLTSQVLVARGAGVAARQAQGRRRGGRAAPG